MKKIIFIIIFIIPICLIYAQNTNYFNKLIFPFPGANCSNSVVLSDSFYYVFGGNVDTPFYYYFIQGFEILKLDLSGNIIDKRMWIDSSLNLCYGNFYSNGFIRAQNGNFYSCGSVRDSNCISYGVLICINKNFDTLWTRIFTHPDTLAAAQLGANVFNSLTAIKKTWDGGFIITGNYNKDCISGNIRSYLLKTDSLGNKEWIKLYGNVESLFDLEIAADSGFYFPASINNQLLAVKTDKLGNIQWSVKVNSNSNPSYPMDLEIGENNMIYICSAFWYDLVYNNRGITVSKVNTITKTKVWEKNFYLYLNFKSYPLHQSMGLDILPDGSLIVSGTSQLVNLTGTNPHKGVMMKLNQNGDSLWARYYGYGDFKDVCQFNDIALTKDGGFLCVGFHFSPQTGGNQNAWIVKMDSLGCDTPGCQKVGIKEFPDSYRDGNQELKIYPNPFTNSLTLEIKDNIEEAEVYLYDIVGKQVMHTKITGSQAVLNTSVLKEGIYLIKVVSGNGKVFVGKVVKN